MATTQTGIPFIDCGSCGTNHPATRSHCASCGRASLFISPSAGICLVCGGKVKMEISRKTINAFYARVRPGARMECTDNTAHAKVIGTNGTVTRANGAYIGIRLDDGKGSGMNVPRNVRDVKALTADSITYEIGGGPDTATWRIVADAAS